MSHPGPSPTLRRAARSLLVPALFLLAGAAVNVTVAWGCALAPTQWRHHDQSYSSFASVDRWCRPGHDWVVTRAIGPDHVSVAHSQGLPLRALAGHEGYELFPVVVPASDERPPLSRLEALATGGPSGVQRRWLWKPGAALPYVRLALRPLWPGFAVNTLAYAALLWLLIPGPFALRRLIRRRRRRCVACGYPLGDSDLCSECGEPVPGRAAVT